VTLTGTYQRIADAPTASGYDDVLLSGNHHYRLRLPPGAAPQPGARVTVAADRAAEGRLDVASFTTVPAVREAARPAAATNGVTRVLTILAYWTAPDTVTPARVKQQILVDDDAWFREVSYGQVGLTGAVTPWVRIAAPTGGRCYEFAAELMAAAQAKAKAIGYDAAGYDRTILYFPRCTGGDTKNVAGWAFEPGTHVWLNGYMDRRTSVHEQGHNYGMGHARSYACTSGGVRVTLGTTCVGSEYGDPYDAMGASSNAAHFGAYNKDLAGWLGGRKRVLTTASGTFVLAPYEQASSSLPVAVVKSPVPGRAYWLEYRRPVGYDAGLAAGATGGVLVRLQDRTAGAGQWLLDATPGDATFATSVVRAGTSWTAPDGVRIAVGTIGATGAHVTVTGAKVEPTAPGAVRSLTAVAGDGEAEIRWAAPLSDGGEPVSSYDVEVEGPWGKSTETVPDLGVTIGGLYNGWQYTFRVSAVNVVGNGPALPVTARPVEMLPSLWLASPQPDQVVRGTVPLDAVALPHPVSQRAIEEVTYYVDGGWVGSTYAEPWHVDWVTPPYVNGRHTVRAVARDARARTVTSEVAVTLDNPVPSVAITAPVDATTADVEAVTFESTAAVAPGSAATIARVEYLVDGYSNLTATAPPYRASFDARSRAGWHRVVATAYDSTGLWARSAAVTFTVVHPPPTVRVAAPLDASTVTGTTVALTADATAPTNGATVQRVTFLVNGSYLSEDAEAPYEATWDTGALTGAYDVSARVQDSNGQYGTSPVAHVTVGNVLPAVLVAAPSHRDYGYSNIRVDPLPQAFSGTARSLVGGATVERVSVAVDGKPLAATFADDGTWNVPWDATGRYGNHSLVVTAYDTAGLRATRVTDFTVVHPVPVVTFAAPVDGALLGYGSRYDIAVAAVPGRYDPATVLSVCFTTEYGRGLGCGSVGADGRYHLAWLVDSANAYQRIVATVRMSDGSAFQVPGPSVAVAMPPGVPVVTAQPGLDGTASVSWLAPNEYGPSVVTAHVVSVVGGVGVVGGATRTVTGPGPVTFTGLANGVRHTFSVAAVNAAGTGPAATVTAMPGTPTYAGVGVSGPATVTYGGRFSVTAAPEPVDDRGAVIAGQPVEVTACSPTDFTACTVVARGVTGTSGRVTLSFVPVREAFVRLNFLGGGRYLESRDDVGFVQVAARVTGTLSATAVRAGATAYLAGVVSPARNGGFVYLQRYYGGAWHDVTYRTQSAAGAVRVPIKVPRGTYTYRLRYGASRGRLAGVSPTRTLTVT
jgi:hypothetical protein